MRPTVSLYFSSDKALPARHEQRFGSALADTLWITAGDVTLGRVFHRGPNSRIHRRRVITTTLPLEGTIESTVLCLLRGYHAIRADIQGIMLVVASQPLSVIESDGSAKGLM